MADGPSTFPAATTWRARLAWHEPGTSKEEKWLIRKLDLFILSYTSLTFFIKFLDQTNINNAYASGMAMELNLNGDELSWMNTYFYIGLCLGGPVCTVALNYVRPRFWLPSITLVWSLFVLGMHKCTSASQIYVLRFFLGFFESGAMPGCFYMLGCWYRKSEINRRSAIFMLSATGGSMFSSYLQAGLYSGMQGKGGLSAWRWLMVFNFILGVPVALFGFLTFPDTPKTTRAWWLNDWERKRAIDRMEEEGHGKTSMKLGRAALKRIACSWQLWAFSLAWIFWTMSCGGLLLQWITLYLRSMTMSGQHIYTVPQINAIPTIASAVGIVIGFSCGFLADHFVKRSTVLLGLGTLLIFCFSILAAWPSSHKFRLSAYFLAGSYAAVAPLLSAAGNEACGGDDQLRAFVQGFTISLAFAVGTPVQQYMFPTSQAPTFKKTHAYAFGAAWLVVMTVWIALGLPLVARRAKRREEARVKAQQEETKGTEGEEEEEEEEKRIA